MTVKLQNYWPSGLSGLVVKAAFHSDSNVANAAWSRWQDECNFDNTFWSDVRTASLAYRRLGQAQDAKALEPRLNGLQRYIWSAVNMRLDAAIPLLRHFQKADVKFIMIKGSALQARDPQAATDRFMTDVDVLIDHASWEKAVDIALADGWSTQFKVTRDTAIHRIRQLHHSFGLVRDRNGSVDLHNFSLHLNQQLGADAGLWQRAVAGKLKGMSVRLPHPSDQLAIVLGHCFLYAPLQSHDWIYDARATIATPGFDWDLFGNVIIERELAVPAAAGLSYLAEELAWPIPKKILERIVDRVREPFLSELAAVHRSYKPNKAAQVQAIYRAECIRSRRSMSSVARQPSDSKRRTAETAFANVKAGEKVYLAMPSGVQSGQCVDFRLILEGKGFPPRTSSRAFLRCFEFIPLEFGRLSIDPRQKRQELTGRIDGALTVARGIDQIWLGLEKEAPPGASLQGTFSASVANDPWLNLRRITSLFTARLTAPAKSKGSASAK